MNTEFDVLLKMLLVGPECSGKTCLLMRYANDTFSESSISTIGIDFKIKTIELPNGKRCKLQIWDTAGKERFRTITFAYFRGAHVVMVVVALDDPEWLQNMKTQIELTNKYGSENAKIAVVGNKKDLDRVVTFEEISKVVEGLGLPYYEVSAKTAEGVTETFFNIVYDATRAMFKSSWNKKETLFGKKN